MHGISSPIQFPVNSSTMKHFLPILFLTLFLGSKVMAQRTMLPSNPGISLSYVGDQLTNPGGKIGFDYPLLIWENRKEVPTRKGGYNRTRSTQLIGQSSLGYYIAPQDHQSFFFQLEAGYRNMHHRSTFGLTALRLDLSGGAAFMFFAPSGDGSEGGDRSDLAGSMKVLPSISLTLAQDYKLSRLMRPISIFIKGNALYGNGNLYPSAELGILFRGIAVLDNLPKKVSFTRN